MTNKNGDIGSGTQSTELQKILNEATFNQQTFYLYNSHFCDINS